MEIGTRVTSQLLDELCTPGGVTVEGVKILEERAMRGIVIAGVIVAEPERSKSISSAPAFAFASMIAARSVHTGVCELSAQVPSPGWASPPSPCRTPCWDSIRGCSGCTRVSC